MLGRRSGSSGAPAAPARPPQDPMRQGNSTPFPPMLLPDLIPSRCPLAVRQDPHPPAALRTAVVTSFNLQFEIAVVNKGKRLRHLALQLGRRLSAYFVSTPTQIDGYEQSRSIWLGEILKWSFDLMRPGSTGTVDVRLGQVSE